MSLPTANHRIVAVTPKPAPENGITGGLQPPSGVRSMTGFASASQGAVQVELRSVNSRFLDLTVKMPERLRSLEAQMRARIQQTVKRGKLELRIGIAGPEASVQSLQVQTDALNQLQAVLGQLAPAFPNARPFSLLELLQMPGMLKSAGNEDNQDQAQAESDSVMNLLDQVMTQFDASRLREGSRLAQIVLTSGSAMQAVVGALSTDAPRLIAASQARLSERLAKALTPSVDSPNLTNLPPQWSTEIAERLRQEVASLGLRADVAEELGRLEIHLQELSALMHRDGEIGKRLDFLCQELNREANTLGSKSVAIELSNASMELKLLIEQVREQAQNFE